MAGFLVTFDGDYKAQKEAWVTGFTGAAGYEVALVVATVPVSGRPRTGGGAVGKCTRAWHVPRAAADPPTLSRFFAGVCIPKHGGVIVPDRFRPHAPGA
jgi:hypothetical protein